MNELLKKLKYCRGHLLILRQISVLRNIKRQSFRFKSPVILDASKKVLRQGWAAGPKLTHKEIASISSLYNERMGSVKKRSFGAPFQNLMNNHDFNLTNPLWKLVFSSDVLDVAIDYFGGKVILESVQVLCSYSTNGKLRESQLWHKDASDSKSFHYILYLNDVISEDDGPFTFVDKKDSKLLRRSLFVRRIDDASFFKELGKDDVKRFYGEAGSSIYVDPVACYHYGSRCIDSRLALFITFNSNTPWLKYPTVISNKKEKLFEIGRSLRPDISEKVLKNILDI